MQPVLAPWSSFYALIGTAAASLIGLQFIAVSLITSRNRAASIREINAFATPNIVLFAISLLSSAILTAPWRTLRPVGFCLAALGAFGVWHSLRSMWHARRTHYRPDAEDWFWYVGLPLAGHCAMFVFGCLVVYGAIWPIAAASALALGFLFIGIHNTWDTVTYIASHPEAPDQKQPHLTEGE